MFVESHDRFDVVADFDPATGRLAEVNRADGPTATAGTVRGHYARLSGTLTVFYRLGNSLWLRIGSQARDLGLVGLEVGWVHVDGRSTLTLLEQGVLIAEIRYQPRTGGGAKDPTPFAESEDWDFGLFVKSVLGDEGRRARIYGGTSPSW